MNRFLSVLGVLVLLVFVLFVGGCILLSRDIPKPDVSDFVVERMPVPEEDNAYTWLVQATNVMVWPDEGVPISELLDGETNAPGLVAELVATNAEMFAFVDKAVDCPVCHPPEITSFDTLLPYLSKWRNIGRLMALKATQERGAGNLADSARTTASLIRFADLLQRDAECLINYLVGIAILDLGMTQARDLVGMEEISAEELDPLLRALADMSPFHPGLIRAIKVEYRVTSKLIGEFGTRDLGLNEFAGLSETPSFLTKGKGIPRYFFQPNRTRQLLAETYRNMIENAPRNYADMDITSFEDAPVSRLRMLKPNAVGHILQRLLLPAFDSMLERKCRAQCMATGTRLVIACKAYEQRNGALPETLAALVPLYFSAAPIDPYDGKPFRYLPARRIVYSVGVDLEDANGSSDLRPGETDRGAGKNHWTQKDPVFPIP